MHPNSISSIRVAADQNFFPLIKRHYDDAINFAWHGRHTTNKWPSRISWRGKWCNGEKTWRQNAWEACVRSPAEWQSPAQDSLWLPLPESREDILLLGCMKCWSAEICMISKCAKQKITASPLWRPLIIHKRVRFQRCCMRLHPALSNVLMQITNDLLITECNALYTALLLFWNLNIQTYWMTMPKCIHVLKISSVNCLFTTAFHCRLPVKDNNIRVFFRKTWGPFAY